MTGRKTNAILAANGGLDSTRALSKAREMLLFHDLRQPVLYHVVITGSESVATYQATIKALVRRLRNYGCRTEYFGAFENQPLKGMHVHVFLLIETSKKTPGKIMNIGDGEYLHKLVQSKPVLKLNDGKPLNRVHIAKPKNPMHGGDFFARPVGDKLENCLAWVTYIFKMRSKQGVERRETYFNSEFTANKAIRAAELAALTAAPATQHYRYKPYNSLIHPCARITVFLYSIVRRNHANQAHSNAGTWGRARPPRPISPCSPPWDVGDSRYEQSGTTTHDQGSPIDAR